MLSFFENHNFISLWLSHGIWEAVGCKSETETTHIQYTRHSAHTHIQRKIHPAAPGTRHSAAPSPAAGSAAGSLRLRLNLRTSAARSDSALRTCAQCKKMSPQGMLELILKLELELGHGWQASGPDSSQPSNGSLSVSRRGVSLPANRNTRSQGRGDGGWGWREPGRGGGDDAVRAGESR